MKAAGVFTAIQEKKEELHFSIVIMIFYNTNYKVKIVPVIFTVHTGPH